MTITVISLFPSMVESPLSLSIIGRAIKKGVVKLQFVNIRDFATDSYKTVDDHPYGGGAGMILRVDVMDRALKSAVKLHEKKPHIILVDPGGTRYTEKKAIEYSGMTDIIIVCGHYEGVDDRIRGLIDEEISIGPYVVTSGELAATILIDSVVRLLPGVLKDPSAPKNESFTSDEFILEYPQYTRPPVYEGMKVPEILLSGDHGKIKEWQLEKAAKRSAGKEGKKITG
jgi:tRNA (guanine37-N1)-methyltransferase